MQLPYIRFTQISNAGHPSTLALERHQQKGDLMIKNINLLRAKLCVKCLHYIL